MSAKSDPAVEPIARHTGADGSPDDSLLPSGGVLPLPPPLAGDDSDLADAPPVPPRRTQPDPPAPEPPEPPAMSTGVLPAALHTGRRRSFLTRHTPTSAPPREAVAPIPEEAVGPPPEAPGVEVAAAGVEPDPEREPAPDAVASFEDDEEEITQVGEPRVPVFISSGIDPRLWVSGGLLAIAAVLMLVVFVGAVAFGVGFATGERSAWSGPVVPPGAIAPADASLELQAVDPDPEVPELAPDPDPDAPGSETVAPEPVDLAPPAPTPAPAPDPGPTGAAAPAPSSPWGALEPAPTEPPGVDDADAPSLRSRGRRSAGKGGKLR